MIKMRELVLKIPERKLKFFLELCKQLGIEVSDNKTNFKEGTEVSEEHQSIVRERIKKSTSQPDRILDWEWGKRS